MSSSITRSAADSYEPKQGGAQAEVLPHRPIVRPVLVLSALAVFGGLATLETLRQAAFPDLTPWKWQLVNIAAGVLAAVVAAYFGLRRQSKTFEKAVQEAERKGVEAELEKAKTAAEAASRDRREFFAQISHEIRTPLNGILGMTELALITELTPDQRDCLEMVRTSADSLLIVLNALLDYSRIQAGSLDLDQTEFNLRESLGDAMLTLALWAHQKNLEIVCHVRPEVPEAALGDPARLRQIILSLAGNAIQFSEQGEVIVEVATESLTESNLSLHFTLTDTGIPVEKKRLIFQSWAEGDSMREKYEEMGLGVAVSTRLVEMMGGRVWVEDEESEGSTFHFTAQFGRAQAQSTMAVPEARLNLQEAAALVVDDSATNRRILEEMLVQWHMKPTLADGGLAAIAALEHAKDAGKPFPLVILDAYMPDMEGFALAQRIQQNPQLAGATVMMLSAAGQRRDATRSRELGIAACAVKPIKQSDLLRAVITALEKTTHKAEQPVLGRPVLREVRPRPRILLVEDNLVNQKLVVRWLERTGHAVAVAGNGREALAALEKPAPGFDLVLMDIKMPEMDGFEATAAIREKEKGTGGHLPIIALTAQALKGDRERCLAAGMDGYVSKPVRVKSLFDAIESLIPRSGGPAIALAHDDDAVMAWAEASGTLDGQPLLTNTMRLLRDESRKLLSAMREAITRQDAKALEDATQTLESSSRHFSAEHTFGAVPRWENLRGEDPLRRAEAYVALEEEFERVRQVFADLGKGVSR